MKLAGRSLKLNAELNVEAPLKQGGPCANAAIFLCKVTLAVKPILLLLITASWLQWYIDFCL